jgi:release factor glutamine methyltransferase
MTYKKLMNLGIKKIETNESLEIEVAKLLLMHYSTMSPTQFYLNFDKEVSTEVEAKYLKAIDQYVLELIPMQHILGFAPFFGYDFIVNEHVLIPRRETELLAEHALYVYDTKFSGKTIDVCDIGTGSGCIAITLSLEEANMNVVASDISEEALKVAKRNNEALGGSVKFYQGDLLEPLKGLKFDMIVSNPPYIPKNEDVMDLVKKNEPSVALFGGDSGLVFYDRILKESLNYLKPNGVILFEHAYDKKEEMKALCLHYYKDATIEQLKDLSQKDRMTIIYT